MTPVKKRLLLIGGNYFPEPTGIGKYSGQMIQWLAANGYECTVVTTYPYYPFWKVQPPYKGRAFLFKKERMDTEGSSINIHRCPHYVPVNPTGKHRILSDLSFFISAFLQTLLLLFRKKHHFVMVTAPPFQVGMLGLMYKWLKGAKMIYHVHDLQIDAAKELGMIRSRRLIGAMLGIERFILKHADFVTAVSEGIGDRLRKKLNRGVVLFPNWADLPPIEKLERKEARKRFGMTEEKKIVLYSGAIGEKQGLQTMLAAAALLKEHEDIHFIICGSGPYRQPLMEHAQELNLTNLTFFPVQPQEQFLPFLMSADLHLVLQRSGANDLVMPSKLTNILSIGGLSVVTAEPGTSLHKVVNEHQMGLLIEPENPEALAEAVLQAMECNHEAIRQNAQAYAREWLNVDRILYRFQEEIEMLVNRFMGSMPTLNGARAAKTKEVL